MPNISVVIPSYNEMVNLQKGVLDKVEHFFDRHHPDYEVIISDDGSTDGSLEFVEKFTKENSKFRVVRNAHSGKAGAVTAGMLKASGDLILFTDMDQATPIEEIDRLLPFFSQKFDVVIGSRNSSRRGSPFVRRFISKSQVILRKVMVGLFSIEDTQCGFKMFTKQASKDLFSKINNVHQGFSDISGSNVSSGFDVELLYLANKTGYKIKEVPVEWLYVETRRVNPIKDSIEGVLDLLRIKGRILRKEYSL